MSEWNRSTTELPLERIHPEISAAIQKHIQSYNLGAILDDYQICIETVSDKKKKRLFGIGGNRQTTQVVILTPEWLVIGSRGDKPESSAALSVMLKDAVVEDYADSPAYKLLPDNGLHVTGNFTGRVGMHGFQRVTSFITLGEGRAAREFKELLSQAIQETRK
jgi:hypothetical protein